MTKKKGNLRIGTGGYAYPHWQGALYPETLDPDQWFEHYAGLFDTVALDTTFYRTPSPAMVEKWREESPPDFRFLARGAKVITHTYRLRGCGAELGRFRTAMSRLGRKLAAVIWQMPSGFRMDLRRLGAFLNVVTRTWRTRHVVEFRHPSWLVEPTYELLRRHKVCLAHGDKPRSRVVDIVTAGSVVLLRHGPRGSPQKAYADRALRQDAENIKQWLAKGLDVWVCFNNDAEGFAVRNAKRLRQLCQG